jgi:predicted RNA-binding protein with PUA-like domain
MRIGDPVLFYRSQQDQAIVGLMQVAREAYPDPTSHDPKWITCDFVPIETIPPVTLESIRTTPALCNLPLLRQPRLSVMRVSADEFRHLTVIKHGN